MNKGADIVSKALLGIEAKTIVVDGKPYFVKPPTIRQIAGVGMALAGMDSEITSLKDLFNVMHDTKGAAKALSYFVNGDESLTETFENATLGEVVNALESCMTLIGIQDFQKLSGLSRSVRHLIANPK